MHVCVHVYVCVRMWLSVCGYVCGSVTHCAYPRVCELVVHVTVPVYELVLCVCNRACVNSLCVCVTVCVCVSWLCVLWGGGSSRQ